MIKREHHLEKIRGFYDTDLIKIITGIRRSGKSIILGQIMDEIKNKNPNVIYLNFEDYDTKSSIPNAKALIDYVNSQHKSGLNYLFFDEIQEVDDWALACKTLRLKDNSIFITGSNSKLLGKEYISEFSGRYVSFQIRPFVYKEIIEYTKKLKKDCTVMDYLVWGGFPKRFELSTDEERNRYLTDLNESIVKNDLIVRYKIKNIELFQQVVNFVLQSNSRIISSNSINSYLKNEHIDSSVHTIINYLNYLEEAYVIQRVKPYSTKTKTELSYRAKVYDADVSFNSIRSGSPYDLTHNLENIVYNELIYMGYSVYVLNNDDGGEIDFYIKKGNKKYYVQVAYSVVEEKAYKREFEAFNKLDNAVQKVLITTDEIDFSTSTVRHISLKDFLLLEEL